MALVPFDPSVLLNYYSTRPSLTGLRSSTSRTQAAQPTLPPWDFRTPKPSQESRDVSARGNDPYFDPKDKSLTAKLDAAVSAGSQLEAILKSTLSQRTQSAEADPKLANDNNKLFALYKALNRLEYIAEMANRDGGTAPRPRPEFSGRAHANPRLPEDRGIFKFLRSFGKEIRNRPDRHFHRLSQDGIYRWLLRNGKRSHGAPRGSHNRR